MNITQIEKVLPALDGWCTIEKARAMMELVERERPAVLVEIGVFGGRSLAAMADACRQNGYGHVHGIDPWSAPAALESVEESANIDWWAKVDYEGVYTRCKRALWAMQLEPFVTIMRLTAEEAAPAFAPESIDVLHIDGNHSEASSTRDVTLYLPRVRTGGHIWFDDMDWPSTHNALRIMREQCEEVGAAGTCGLFRKIP